MYAVVQIGSRILRSAWGTKRSVAPRLCAYTCGAPRLAAAPTVPARNERRLRVMAASSGAPIVSLASFHRQATGHRACRLTPGLKAIHDVVKILHTPRSSPWPMDRASSALIASRVDAAIMISTLVTDPGQ